MENQYQYFKRDISWLSFNYRVLLEAEDDTLPLYERINFISIYSSNLEEFYKIRVADHKAIATGAAQSDEETVQSTIELVDAINLEVNRQMEDRIRIYEQKILPALKKNHIIFYQSRNVEPFHRDFVRRFFREEIFPFLQPVPVSKDKVILPARQPPVSGRPPSPERIAARCSRTYAVLRDEATLQQSTPFHRTTQSGEQLLPDVHRRYHQGQSGCDLSRL